MGAAHLSPEDLRWAGVEQLEHWASKRLNVDLFAGISDRGSRRQLLAQTIVDRTLQHEIARRTASGRDETWAQLFARFYGCSLEQCLTEARFRA